MRAWRQDTTASCAGGRRIGPVGTAMRIAVGAIAVAVPIELAGFSWWEAVVALVALPLITLAAAPLITAIYRRLAPHVLTARHPLCAIRPAR